MTSAMTSCARHGALLTFPRSAPNLRFLSMRFAIAFGLVLGACAHAPVSVSDEAPVTADDDPLLESYRAAYQSADAASYKDARDRHAVWLAANASAPNARDVRVRYGKLLYALGDFDAAAQQLAQVTAGGADYLGRGAARNVIVVWNEARTQRAELRPLKERGRVDRVTLNFETGPITLPDYSAGDVAERPIPALEQALADACDHYFDISDGQDTALPTFRLMSADIYFRSGHAIEGAKRCADLVSRWPQTEIAESCVLTTVDALNAKKAWSELEQHARAFRNNLSLIGADHVLEQRLELIVQVSTFNRIQAAAESKSPRDPAVERRALIKGADEFRAFQREFPYSESADEALYNAFVYYARAQKRAEAIAAGQVLVAMYSSSPLVREVQRGLRSLESSPNGARASR